MARSFMEHTEILDDDLVAILNAPEVIVTGPKKKKNIYFSYVKSGIVFVLVGYLAFQSFQMSRISASIKEASFNVEKNNLYQYQEVSFPEMDYSYPMGS